MTSTESPYVVEEFTEAEAKLLAHFVTSLSAPAFGLINMPEVVKGALFGRYSRSLKSLRRLLLDEFINREEIAVPAMVEQCCGQNTLSQGELQRLQEEQTELWQANKQLGFEALAALAPTFDGHWLFGPAAHAEAFYRRVFGDYGDDSVAQLGSAHVAMEQMSNLLIKEGPERGRLGSAIEQSTRYLDYGTKVGGRFRYYLAADIMSGPHAKAFVEGMDSRFEAYRRFLPVAIDYFRELLPKELLDADSLEKKKRVLTDNEYQTALKTQSFDAIRGLLPIGTYSHLGIHASAQSFETMLLRMLAHPLPESQQYARFILDALQHPQMIPAFMTGIEKEDKGGQAIKYLSSTQKALQAHVTEIVSRHGPMDEDSQEAVNLVWYDPDGQYKVAAAMLYEQMPPQAHWPLDACFQQAKSLSEAELNQLLAAGAGERRNRRHRPSRSIEEAVYGFDLLTSYGIFRDLQRHRLLTIEWQDATPYLGFYMPLYIEQMGLAKEYQAEMAKAAELYELIRTDHPASCQYVVLMAHKLRYRMTFNGQTAMHLTEIRSGEQGHPEYRQVAQQIHQGILGVHPQIGGLMKFVDYNEYSLARLSAEQRLTDKRRQRGDD
jgi:thymidylate synthase ThyX